MVTSLRNKHKIYVQISVNSACCCDCTLVALSLVFGVHTFTCFFYQKYGCCFFSALLRVPTCLIGSVVWDLDVVFTLAQRKTIMLFGSCAFKVISMAANVCSLMCRMFLIAASFRVSRGCCDRFTILKTFIAFMLTRNHLQNSSRKFASLSAASPMFLFLQNYQKFIIPIGAGCRLTSTAFMI